MDLFDEAADFRDREAQEAYNRMMRRLDEIEAGTEACPHCGALPYVREPYRQGFYVSPMRFVCARCKQ